MLLSSLTRRVAPLAKPSTVAMLCTVASHRLPCATASAARRAAAAPFPAASVPARSFASILTRAQKEPTQSHEHEDAGQKQQQQSQPESQQLQRTSQQQGGELSAMPFGGDLMGMRSMMPTPFRRMTDHMMQMQREMDSLMGAFGMPSALMADPFDIFDRVAAAPLMARRAGGPLGRLVPLQVAEDDKGYTVTAEVPGFDKNEIKVSLSEDGVLTMRGSHEEGGDTAAGKEGEKAATGGGARSYASFVRSVSLPEDTDTDGISANTQHGVLTVRIPKTAKPAPKVREIPVA